MPSTKRIVANGFLVAALLCAWSRLGLAQTTGASANPPAADDSQAAAELAKQASNPLSSAWLIQTQQNNNWVGMPLKQGDRVDSDLLLQPLVNAKLTDQWTLLARPILTLFNSTPYVAPGNLDARTTGFGDMVLAFALSPRPMLGGKLTIAAGPTFIFPTATDTVLGQQTWQAGPDVGIVYAGKHYLAYVFPQQWFKIGGSGAKTSQLSMDWSYTYFLQHGWSVGTSPNFLVDWEAERSQRLSFPIGPQVGKLCKCGHTPTLFQLQLEYYPVHATVNSPKWNVQLQITPTIRSLIRRKLF
jgi:hypothetical protein